ncbi:EscU/YscU/HrcU family type III secretion system export apparatus switch protein [Advenella mimigardefordensis]|uniref:Putative type III secretion system translocation protein n=1 Tax=Advenella mimigardefordensis (strain DSM 17166 / LMG 22922 / DPN7) TaxID=1247726 RepID=W0P620_ADVMD|nr:EscU/YscU/HrcU family type III secretion system export apparatus switch protein [Advenella mimigardefordensis]AHG62181.1 putative type III secretion system translocation protein [Advenella mimigardefordensis DPN7]
MSDKSSEEKSQPASEKKLRDSRKKGQVAKSQDMITALVVLACVAYLSYFAGDVSARVLALFQQVADALASRNMVFTETWPTLLGAALDLLMRTTFPLLLVIVLVVILGNMIIQKGFLFSVDPVKPDFNRLNPAEGFKRLFSARNLVEFLKAVFKVAALAAAFVFVYRASLPLLFGAPACGVDCIFESFKVLFVPITLTAVLAFFISGLVDLLLQRWLFAREMRMSHSELKRERKDIDGSPEIRKERNRQRRASQVASSARGAHMASVIVGGPGNWIVGLRYRRGETKVPVIVHVVQPGSSEEAWFAQQRETTPLIHDPGLAADIARRARVGDALPDAFFERVARILVKEGLI